ncbi:FMN-binding negative transcriptional regulator [uncultured Rhodoferax sp.]|uniref:FMN-binding negative transcriptional regulator n=1 Tax=uncultured Rhodoferax sp. TaxID=223188 RepID=UPI0025DED7DD|nr:FMN-binding negative transcriptional regulator [uncultured Rhodoferax sp.]
MYQPSHFEETRPEVLHALVRAQPWAVDDAPRDYTDKMVAAVVGIEIPVSAWSGKWKVSQNQPSANQVTVEQGLRGLGTEAAAAMAGLVVAKNG